MALGGVYIIRTEVTMAATDPDCRLGQKLFFRSAQKD